MKIIKFRSLKNNNCVQSLKQKARSNLQQIYLFQTYLNCQNFHEKPDQNSYCKNPQKTK